MPIFVITAMKNVMAVLKKNKGGTQCLNRKSNAPYKLGIRALCLLV